MSKSQICFYWLFLSHVSTANLYENSCKINHGNNLNKRKRKRHESEHTADTHDDILAALKRFAR